VVNDWETAYYSEFSSWGGQYPIVVSYGSSPPFEVIFAEEPMDEPPTAAIISDGSCFRQIEFVGILKGTQNRDLAEKFIDFMLSPTFQEDIPLQMYVFPVNPDAQLDETFEKYLAVPENPATLDPADIAAHREKWINDWTETVLR
jgi:thiamine transport system substrate-binding protein